MINIIVYVLFIIIVTEIIEYDKNWKHVLIINFGLLMIALNLSTIVDFSTIFTIPITGAALIFGSERSLKLATQKYHDPDEDL